MSKKSFRTSSRISLPLTAPSDSQAGDLMFSEGDLKLCKTNGGSFDSVGGASISGRLIDTVFGRPSQGGRKISPSGLAFYNGALYFSDISSPTSSGNGMAVYRLNGDNSLTVIAGTPGTTGSTGDGGLATAATLNLPRGIAFDSVGNLCIATPSRVRRVDAATGIISTAVEFGISGASGVAFDSSDNLYVVDSGTHAVYKIEAGTGTRTTFAGNMSSGSTGDGGPATAAKLNGPTSIAIDAANNVYIADFMNKKVRKVTAATGIISTVLGASSNATTSYYSGVGTGVYLQGANSVALDSAGNLYATEVSTFGYLGSMLWKLDTTGQASVVAGQQLSGSAVDSHMGDGSLAANAIISLGQTTSIGCGLVCNGETVYIAEVSRISKIYTA